MLCISLNKGKNIKTQPLRDLENVIVLEVVQNDGNGTYRTMYTVQFEEILYVLHAFQKKSKTGIKTTKQDMDLVEKRLIAAQYMHKEWLARQKKRGIKNG